MNSFDWNKEAEIQWDNRAAFWNERSKNMWDNGSRKNIVPFIAKHLKKGESIVDVGCGDGYGSYKLFQSGFDVSGIDLSNEMINLAKKQLQQTEIPFQQGDVTSLPYKSNHFDAVMAINVLEWTEIPVKALVEIRRVLKKDGQLFIGILGPTAGPRANSYRRIYGEETICNTMMPWEFQQLAQENNFEYIDGFGVYKDGVKKDEYKDLPLELKQALTFMWVFCLRKVGDQDG